jgi:hypothetical protein
VNPSVDVVRHFLPRLEVLAHVQPHAPHMTVMQITGGWEKTSLIPRDRVAPDEKPPPPWLNCGATRFRTAEQRREGGLHPGLEASAGWRIQAARSPSPARRDSECCIGAISRPTGWNTPAFLAHRIFNLPHQSRPTTPPVWFDEDVGCIYS